MHAREPQPAEPPATLTDAELRRAANVVRGLAIDAVQAANSGHPGLPMGMADLAVALWLEHLRFAPKDPAWPGRDRFVLSAGHGSMLLYALLHLAGYELPLDELKRFRQLHGKTPGHPEHGLTPGVETSTGPLGQGFANGVGMALAARMEAARYGCPLLDAHRVVGIVSDGDLMEGVAHEAASLAGHWRLSNLVYLYDDNRITIDGSTSLCFSEDVEGRFAALGWRVLTLDDGHDQTKLRAALREAFAASDRPTLLICRTQIGYGSPNKAGKSSVHGSPLGADELAKTKAALGLPAESFWIPDDVRALFARAAQRGEARAAAWRSAFEAWRSTDALRAAEQRRFATRDVPADLLERLVAALGDAAGATRALSGKVLQTAAELVPSLVTGAADLDGSTKTKLLASGAVQAGAYGHRNLHFGVREHAMGAIQNGMALHGGFLPVGSTFLVFADYMRPPLRLAALMGLPSIFVFSHDSIMVGEDGPTHQPIEQITTLRVIPHLHVLRPADGIEVAAAWTHALARRDGPTAILLTRQDLPRLARPADFVPRDVLRGGYVVRETSRARATLIATGSEVALAVAASELLSRDGFELRVVSMPSIKLFSNQAKAWREKVLPPGLPVLAIELGRPEHWVMLTGSLERVIGVERFGLSAPAEKLAEEFGFTPEAVAEQVRAVVT
ncbi:MAG: transketolase [Planctomycetes bacterium]|nr:transketolase [Planctomycetota bacterium]